MRLGIALATAALLAPASACASTAAVRQTDAYEGTVDYVAAAGEANDLVVRREGNGLELTDTGAAIVASGGCTPSGAHSVTCSPEGLRVSYLEGDLGDGDDSFTTAGSAFLAYDVQGGPGRDELAGGIAPGMLSGGDDDDVLTARRYADLDGGRGDDRLTGGDESDDLRGGPGTDTMDGGPGEDTVKYDDHRAPVTVDLSDPGSAAGAEGEDDTVADVENAWGGGGDDVLTARAAGSDLAGLGGDDTISGGAGPDEINGHLGRDLISGRAGNDTISGSAGRDTIDAGSGNDWVDSSDDASGVARYQRDVVACGDGSDAVFPIDPGLPVLPIRDLIEADCEVVWTASRVPNIRRLHLTGAGDALRLKVPCVAPQRCLVKIAFQTGGRVAASVRREIREQQVEKLTAPLDAAARRRLEEAGRLRLGMSMTVRWGRRLQNRQVTGYDVLVRREASSP